MPASSSDWSEYKQAVLASIPDFISRYASLKGQRPSTDGWVTALCPFHDDKKPSFAFEKTTGNWKCHGGCGQGTLIDFEAKVRGVTFKDALTDLGDELDVPRPNGKDGREKVYDYTDADGKLLYQVLRKPGKKWTQRQPDGNGGFIPNVKGVPRVLYHLKELAARPDDRVFVVEGEKDADRLAALGLLATTNSGGAEKWRDDYGADLKDRDVVVLPDNDDPGRRHAKQVAESLRVEARSVRIVTLPGLGPKQDVSDWLDAGGNLDQLLMLVDQTPEVKDNDASGAVVTRPSIETHDRPLRDILDDAQAAVMSANDPPRLFNVAGSLARLRDFGQGPQIDILDERAATSLLARAADWVKTRGNSSINVKPPKEAAADIIVNPHPDLPQLDAVIATPIFDRDWRLVTERGYHPEARLWLHVDQAGAWPEVPTYPSPKAVQEALSLILDDLLVDFPFTSDSDKAHAVAALLLPFARRMFDGPTPIHLIEASTPGSGKSLLAELIAMIALGHSAGSTTLTTNEEEVRKKLTAILSRGASVITIDNIQGGLWSAQVASAITAEVWEDRLLGKTQMVTFPNRALWLVSGNNPKLSMEVARRCVRIRLDTGEEQPWKRAGFKHDPIREWVRQNRRALVQAVLTLIQHWIASGAPHASQTLGSFESWSRVVGGMVQHFGLPGFLDDADEFYEAADPETGEWRAFIEAWAEAHGSTPVTAVELLDLAKNRGLVTFAFAAKSDHAERVRFGMSLGALRDRRFGDRKVTQRMDTHKKARVFQLVILNKELFS